MSYDMFYKGEYIGYIEDKDAFLGEEGVTFVERIEKKEPPFSIAVEVYGIDKPSWQLIDMDDVILESGMGTLDYDYGKTYEYKGCVYVLEDHDYSFGHSRFDLVKLVDENRRSLLPGGE
ncbi:hypothetical protein BCB4_0196 [Bacillus phage B4]|uniref:Uncharacterized protein n=2 Tax=Bequatrovirus B4 TaxID=1918005 RepID=J9PRU7_9CAUD|nr:hypothetical protein BCB4_0196 [Bacillus phage B4]YP_009783787.1 hypothetical protein QLX26_gp191 [Bacillus phage B5S]MEB9013778.1 hypothetical protein [Bacillus cereus]AEW47425.1 hypothetical protein B5S_0191 [Bacillus phage B5S]AEZ65989.1 hypothetical protein BCB4_0196 [Bacillus phage B4]MEB9190607.1 hypothetical protein [Bacillus cereus]